MSLLTSLLAPENGTSRLLIYAQEMSQGFGSPTLSNIGASANTRTAAWLMDAVSDEAAGFLVTIPSGWLSTDVVVYWTNGGAGSGDVVWQLTGDEFSIGTAPSNTVLATAAAATAPAQNVLASTTFSGVAAAGDEFWRFHVRRDADNVSDTLINDAGVYAVELRKGN